MSDRDDLDAPLDASLDALDALVDEATDAWATPEVPEGFADRVLAARDAERALAPGEEHANNALGASAGDRVRPSAGRGGSWRRATALPLAAAAAAAALVLVVDHGGAWWPSDGEGQATDRTSFALASRGTAVAEAGAEIAWTQSSGALTVRQDKGGVFYRVDKGGPFVVHTPAGRITVTGTCFNVEVFDMNTVSTLPRSHFLSAAIGAALSAAVVVTVYEGSVELDSGGERIALTAGERGVAAGRAPLLLPETKALAAARDKAFVERDALSAQVEELEAQLKRYMLANANGTDPLISENAALRADLAHLKSELSVEQQMRGEQEGKPFEFPEDISDAYRQDAMQSAVTLALKASGLVGDIHSIDCSEFPCMVQGETLTPGDSDETSATIDEGYRKMQAALKVDYPEDGNSYSNSSWGDFPKEVDGKAYKMRRFSMAVYPKDVVNDDERSDFRRRMRWRNDQLREAWPFEE